MTKQIHQIHQIAYPESGAPWGSDGEVAHVVAQPLPPLWPLSEFFFVLAIRMTSAKSLALLFELRNENLSRFFFSADPGTIIDAALFSGAISGPVL